MIDITFVIYSHTDFLDMLKIQIDQTHNIKNKILIINKNNLCNDGIYSNFKRVVFYDDSEPYGNRLLKTISEIESEFILFSHEIDILIDYKWGELGKLLKWMGHKNVDKIDLHFIDGALDKQNQTFVEISDGEVNDWESKSINELQKDRNYLTIHDDPNTYIYNVNPTLWKTSSFCDLLTFAKNKNYREIEYDETQNYMKKFKIYTLYSNKLLDCGYFKCLDIYKYFHITHYGLLINPQRQTTEFNQSYSDVAEDYFKIIEKYNLKNGSRKFNF